MTMSVLNVNKTNFDSVKNSNVDKEQELAQQFQVLSIPTLVVIKNGKVVNQSAGAKSKADILAMLTN